ncbi:MAG TPA: MurT ligase domain-containing protein [Ktedonobacteraceae bacterium]|nr:MurT ligase domain-containing protein [Ktedonobacteraceae bacterium]
MPKHKPSEAGEARRRRKSRARATVSTRKRPQGSLRAGLAVLGGRAAGALSRRLHLGGGTTIAGVIAQGLYPDIVGHLAKQLQHGSVLVTGTNGKTTTSGFIAAILSNAGLRVWRNREGSNLMRGLAGALIIRAHPNGKLKRGGQAISIFEVDEAVVPQVVQVAPPRVAIFNNLFRDQLDRYGEVDTVASRWQEAIRSLPESSTLVLNADDPAIAYLGESFSGRKLYFGIDDPSLDLPAQGVDAERHQTIDTRTCPHCGGEYAYEMRFYSHMGHYACPHCGYKRPEPDVRAMKVSHEGFDQLRISVTATEPLGELVVPLPGIYNVYNALASITAARALDVPWEPIVKGIEQFKPAFGRGELIQAGERTIRLLLAKNPTGFNEVLRTLFSGENKRHAMIVLNDNIADGKDISWIWDVDFERVTGHLLSLTVAGTRAFDLALRLKYAGVDPQQMSIVPSTNMRAVKSLAGNVHTKAQAIHAMSNGTGKLSRATTSTKEESSPANQAFGIPSALDVALSQTPEGETLFIIPTYTGLLEVRRELERRGLTPHYWEEKGP